MATSEDCDGKRNKWTESNSFFCWIHFMALYVKPHVKTTNEYVLLGHGLDAWNPPTFSFSQWAAINLRDSQRNVSEFTHVMSALLLSLHRSHYVALYFQQFRDPPITIFYFVGPCVNLSGFIDEEQANPLPRNNSMLKVKF